MLEPPFFWSAAQRFPSQRRVRAQSLLRAKDQQRSAELWKLGARTAISLDRQRRRFVGSCGVCTATFRGSESPRCIEGRGGSCRRRGSGFAVPAGVPDVRAEARCGCVRAGALVPQRSPGAFASAVQPLVLEDVHRPTSTRFGCGAGAANHERRADLLSAKRRKSESTESLSAARTLYREWGAMAKVRALTNPETT
jgi:hypothetical protein